MSLLIRTGNKEFASKPIRFSHDTPEMRTEYDKDMTDTEWAIYQDGEKVRGPFSFEEPMQPKELRNLIRELAPPKTPVKPEPVKRQVAKKVAVSPAKQLTPPSTEGLEMDEEAALTTDMTPPPTTPELDAITTEIQLLQRLSVTNIIEIGRRLIDAKEMVGHGHWLPYLHTRLGMTTRQAQNYMAVHRQFGSNTHLVSHLTFTKVLMLLRAPEEDIPALAAGIGDMTISAAEKAVEDARQSRAEAERERKRAEEAEQRAQTFEARAKELEAKPPERITMPDPQDKARISQLETENARLKSAPPPEPVIVQDPETLARLEEYRKQAEAATAERERLQKEAEQLRAKVHEGEGLDARIREREERLKHLAELQQRLEADYAEDDGWDPEGGLKLMTALHRIDRDLPKVLAEVRDLERRGCAGWMKDSDVKRTADSLKELVKLLEGVLKRRANRPINIPVEVE